MKKRVFKGIGLMSGTSLDGVDLASCTFTGDKKDWRFEIETATTITYSEPVRKNLIDTMHMSAMAYAKFHVDLGRFYGEMARKFILKNKLKPDFIASHGHTVFHQPSKGFTSQIGSGAAIAAISGVTTVSNFRIQDVISGGQGAPLVPIGDELLFSRYTHCLNLGGIANISFRKNKMRIASDLGFCNMALNYIVNGIGQAFDKNGILAQSGTVNSRLLHKLNIMKFNSRPFPKSLGREDFEKEFLPLLKKDTDLIQNKLRTVVEYLVHRLSDLDGLNNPQSTLLVTGGGAFNKFLIKCIRESLKCNVVVPDKKTVAYKEALIFAFLGLLRLRHQANILKNVTGASKNSIAGAVYLP